jgi:hypothetical protein
MRAGRPTGSPSRPGTVRGGTIVAIDSLVDPERLRGLDLAILDASPHAINLK